MSRVIILTKILFKTSLDTWNSKNKSKNNSSKFKPLIALAFLPLLFLIIQVVSKLYEGLATIGQQGLVLELSFYVASMMIFVFGILYVMSTFYFSMDINNLLPLPFKPYEILSSKFIVVVFYEYLLELFLIAPVLMVYGIQESMGFMYYIYGLIIFLTIPIIPLVVASIIVMIIMRFTNISKNKDLFRVISGVLGIGIAIGLNILIRKVDNGNFDPQKIMELLSSGDNSLVGIFSSLFPTTKYITDALLKSISISGLTNMIIALLINIIGVAIFVVLGEKLYFKGVVGVAETKASRKELSKVELNKAVEKSPAIITYTLKELRLLFRTPTYLLNCVISGLIWPVFMIVIIAFSDVSVDLNLFKSLFTDPNKLHIGLYILFGMSVFMTISNSITSTAISREGNNFYINKYLPIKYETIIMSKVLSGILISIVGVLLLDVIIYFLFKPSIIFLLSAFVVSLLGIVFSSFIGIYIDIRSPKLNWESEQKAVKQNMNVLTTYLACIVIAGLSIFVGINLDFSILISFIYLISLYMVSNILLYKLLISSSVRSLSSIE